MAKPRHRAGEAKSFPSRSDLQAAERDFALHFGAKNYHAALDALRPLIAKGVRNAAIYHDAAVAALRLERWPEAVRYAKVAAALSPADFTHHDALAHAAGGMRDWKIVQAAGLQALKLRDALVPAHPPVDLPLAQPNAEADLNVIAFSLFGGQSKYCETAILNCLEQPAVYPDWRCRFYVDATVPPVILQRLQAAGAEIVQISPAMAAWPGPMWRFAALDDPKVLRVIFRDADSVISTREAGAVAEWVAQGQNFHAMRDAGSHTELLLAGLWGAKTGALPPMGALINAFLQQPLTDAHFADQLFLRNFVWPYARQDILQHDSLFGFMAGQPFPEGPHRDDFHAGYAEGSPFATISTQQAEGSAVHWCLVDQRTSPHSLICRYPALVLNGHVTAHLPARYARLLASGALTIFVEQPTP